MGTLTRARRLALLLAVAVPFAPLAPRAAGAQWSTVYEQFYLQAPHNWVFRNQYRGADRLFNAFDYGHAILYETLWTRPDAPAAVLEEKEYAYLTRKVLVSPPRVPLEEAAIEVRYARLAPEAKAMFDWAHILHRQLYDVLADERLDAAAKDREVQRLIGYYRTRQDLAFSSRPKSMKLMQEQPYSLAFRKKFPKFNGLIWAYHWMQVGLYEPLVVGRTAEERQSGVRGTVARFWQMLGDPPTTLPHQMPMTPAVAPTFAARYPEAAIIFDNLHSMHDVVSDILANPAVPRDRKRSEILRAARRFRDDTSYVVTPEAWLTMARHMGLENMGGPSVGFVAELPTPSVTYGAVMTHDDRTGEMTGFAYGGAAGGGDAHAGHAAHAAHDTTPAAAPGDSAPDAPERGAMALLERMLADSAIRRRVQADTGMRRMLDALSADMPAEHRMQMPADSAVTKKAAPKKPVDPHAGHATPPPKKPADPHAGHAMPGMPDMPAMPGMRVPPAKADTSRSRPKKP